MRGIAVFISGLFILTVFTMFTGPILEPVLDVVASDPAVQAQGWDSTAANITDTITRWMPLMYIAYLLTWAGAWYFRRERMTARMR